MHPPPHKDVWDPAGRRKSGGKKGKYDEQFRFLRKEIEACFKGKGAELCWPFLAPVGAFFSSPSCLSQRILNGMEADSSDLVLSFCASKTRSR